jgi:ATP-dependent Clp protease ATP-binding subunit ClpA
MYNTMSSQLNPRAPRLLDPSRTGREADKLDRNLRRRVVGQDEAADHVVKAYQTYLAGMACPGRPIGNFLFLGPTGSGKTRMVESAAEALLGDPRAMIKIDCAEFAHSHEIAKLIGSPPGYLGHRETHPVLSQESLDLYHTDKMKLSFVLFDEIEKASDTLWNLLLGILDKAVLTLGDNRRVDFSRTMIFMTSNLGAAEMANLSNPGLGFASGLPRTAVDPSKMSAAGIEAAKRKFTPEFMNRIDKTVVFRTLGDPELRRIFDLEVGYIQNRILQSPSATPFLFECTASVKDHLLKEGTDQKYGARHLKRILERHIVQPLANLIATCQVGLGDRIRIDLDPKTSNLIFLKEAEGLTLADLRRPEPEEEYAEAAVANSREIPEGFPKPVVARSRK